jgi:hypothetical protein
MRPSQEQLPRPSWSVRPRKSARLTARTVASSLIMSTIISLGAPVPVLAAGPSPRDEARSQVNASVRKFDAGDYAGALAGFKRAYETYQSPKILFNIGLAQRKLGQNATAFTSFERFLAEGPAAGAEQRNIDQARTELESLSKRVAFIYVSSDVSSADVTLDGVALGAASLPKRFPVDTGPHTLVLSAVGQSRTHEFSVVAGEAVQAALPLAGAPAPQPSAETSRPVAVTSAPLPPLEPPPPTGLSSESARPSMPSSRRAWLPAARWGTAIGAAGALGVGVLLNVKAISKRQEFDDHQPEPCVATGDTVVSGPSDCYSLAEDFRSQRSSARGAYITAGALGVASLVFFLMDDVVPASSAIVPGVAGSPAGLSYAGRF